MDKLTQYLLQNYQKGKRLLIYRDGLRALLQKPLSPKNRPPLVKEKPIAYSPKKIEKTNETTVIVPRFAENVEEVVPKKPSLPQEEIHKDKPKESSFLLEKIEAKRSLPSLASLYQKIAPHIVVHAHPPSDKEVKRRNLAAKDRLTLPSIPLFVSHQNKKDLSFLDHLAHAIDTTFLSCKTFCIDEIERENRWDNILSAPHLKLIILSEPLLFQCPHLLSSYRETPKRVLKKLKNVPTLLLSDPSLYQKNPQLKKELWLILRTLFRGVSK